MNTSDIIQLLMLIAATIAIIVSAISIIASMKMVREQNQILMFSEYTKRYQEIIVNMPESVYKGATVIDDDVLRSIVR